MSSNESKEEEPTKTDSTFKEEQGNATDETPERGQQQLRKERLKCRYCPASFIFPSKLAIHLRSHTGEKPYQCKLCPRACTTPESLKVHLRRHTGEKPYECYVCGDRFIHRRTFTLHMEKHEGYDPYRCDMCLQGFPLKTQLKDHIANTHTNGIVHKCKLCDAIFGFESSLEHHREKYHPSASLVSRRTFSLQKKKLKIKPNLAPALKSSSSLSTSYDSLKNNDMAIDLSTKPLPAKIARTESPTVVKSHQESNQNCTSIQSSSVTKDVGSLLTAASNVSDEKQLISGTDLREHREPLFSCTLCCSKFASIKELTGHVRVHVREAVDQNETDAVEPETEPGEIVYRRRLSSGELLPTYVVGQSHFPESITKPAHTNRMIGNLPQKLPMSSSKIPFGFMNSIGSRMLSRTFPAPTASKAIPEDSCVRSLLTRSRLSPPPLHDFQNKHVINVSKSNQGSMYSTTFNIPVTFIRPGESSDFSLCGSLSSTVSMKSPTLTATSFERKLNDSFDKWPNTSADTETRNVMSAVATNNIENVKELKISTSSPLDSVTSAVTAVGMEPKQSLRYRCGICLTIHPSIDKLYNHSLVHSSLVYVCMKCNTSFDAEDTFHHHLCNYANENAGIRSSSEPVSPDGRLKASADATDSNTNEEVNMTQDLSSRIRGICGVCEKSFHSLDDIRSHMQSHEKYRQLLICGLCNLCFVVYNKFEQHIHACALKRVLPFFCKLCKNYFVSCEDMEAHTCKPNLAAETNISQEEINVVADQTHDSVLDLSTKNSQDSGQVSKIKDPSCVNTSSLPQIFKKGSANPKPNGQSHFTCSECSLKFFDLTQHKLHQLVHECEKLQPMACIICNSTFSDRLDLTSHMLAHWIKVCDKCCEAFFDLKSWLTHLQTSNCSSMQQRCHLCNMLFPNKTAFCQHYMKVHSNGTLSCYDCHVTFLDEQSFCLHLVNHKPTSFTCNLCFRVFPSESILHEHMCETTSCAVCKIPCMSKEEYAKHTSKHFPAPILCTTCNAMFSKRVRLEQLQAHSVAHDNKGEFLCSLCNMKFFKAESIVAHVEAHHPTLDMLHSTQKIPFSSTEQPTRYRPIAPKPMQYQSLCTNRQSVSAVKDTHKLSVFTVPSAPNHVMFVQSAGTTRPSSDIISRQNSKEQLRTNEDTIPKLISASELSRRRGIERTVHSSHQNPYELNNSAKLHMNIENCERNITCNICNLPLPDAKSFVLHMELHKYTCSSCNKKFWKKEDLQEHKASTHNVPPCVCGICKARFLHPIELKEHVDHHILDQSCYCVLCGIMLPSAEDFNNHNLHHHALTCKFCQRTFDTAENYILHLKNHVVDASDLYTCQACCHSFQGPLDLMDHLSFHEKNIIEVSREIIIAETMTGQMQNKGLHSGFSCPHCVTKLSYYEQLVQHVQQLHGLYFCVICRAVAKEQYDMNLHIESHPGAKLCKDCGIFFSSSGDLEEHTTRIHNHYGCGLCENYFKSGAHLARHMEECHKNIKLRRSYEIFSNLTVSTISGERNDTACWNSSNSNAVTSVEQEDSVSPDGLSNLASRYFGNTKLTSKNNCSVENDSSVAAGGKIGCFYCSSEFYKKEFLHMHMKIAHNLEKLCSCVPGFATNSSLCQHRCLGDLEQCKICCRLFNKHELCFYENFSVCNYCLIELQQVVRASDKHDSTQKTSREMGMFTPESLKIQEQEKEGCNQPDLPHLEKRASNIDEPSCHSHDTSQSYGCGLCDSIVFDCEDQLLSHVAAYHKNCSINPSLQTPYSLYQCCYCSKPFWSINANEQCSNNPFVRCCDECSKTKDNAAHSGGPVFIPHVHTQIKDKPYLPVSSMSNIEQLAKLSEHNDKGTHISKNQSGVFKCDFCSATFTKITKLGLHLVQYHGEGQEAEASSNDDNDDDSDQENQRKRNRNVQAVYKIRSYSSVTTREDAPLQCSETVEDCSTVDNNYSVNQQRMTTISSQHTDSVPALSMLASVAIGLDQKDTLRSYHEAFAVDTSCFLDYDVHKNSFSNSKHLLPKPSTPPLDQLLGNKDILEDANKSGACHTLKDRYVITAAASSSVVEDNYAQCLLTSPTVVPQKDTVAVDQNVLHQADSTIKDECP